MVNFRPMKNYMFFLTNKLIKKYNIKGPFLDAGGGKGDVSLFLLRKGFTGKLIDFSKEAINKSKINIKKYKDKIKIEQKSITNERGKYNFILLWDVIEHIKDDDKVIESCYKNLNKDGYLLLSYATKKKEWRKDDNLYGHLRRYEIKGIKKQLSKFEILEIWDFTFPVFWLMRRLYVNFIKDIKEKDKIKLTKYSSIELKYFKFLNKYLASKLIWMPLWYLCYIFKNYNLGHQSLVLVKKIRKT